ncbi:MAG: class I SAM-dependent methyltransferase [Candidatus Delongbacteria bacterium]|nr:class I SAM-dependent methyltransferase [Candidatus Delongbacteria bacterium]
MGRIIPNWAIGLKRENHYVEAFKSFRNQCLLDDVWDISYNYLQSHFYKNANILEIGAGFGDSLKIVKKHKCEIVNYLAIDHHSGMVSQFSQQMVTSQFVNIKYIQEDVRNWIFSEKNGYDIILCIHSLYRLWSEKSFMLKLINLLNENGILFCLHSSESSPWMSISKLIWHKDKDVNLAPMLTNSFQNIKILSLDSYVNVSNLLVNRGILTRSEVMFLLWLHPQGYEITQESVQNLIEVIDRINIKGYIIDSLIIESYINIQIPLINLE